MLPDGLIGFILPEVFEVGFYAYPLKNKLCLMNYPDLVIGATNTLLLIVLFFYQRNRNKVLEDQLSAQRQLLDETKTVVTQQATAIEGQSKVVDTALKYTSAFDPGKLEELLRREISFSHKEEIDRLKKELAAKSSPQESEVQKTGRLLDRLVEAAANAAVQVSQDLVVSLSPYVVRDMLRIPPEAREEAASHIKPEGLRIVLLRAAALVEKEMAEVTVKPSDEA